MSLNKQECMLCYVINSTKLIKTRIYCKWSYTLVPHQPCPWSNASFPISNFSPFQKWLEQSWNGLMLFGSVGLILMEGVNTGEWANSPQIGTKSHTCAIFTEINWLIDWTMSGAHMDRQGFWKRNCQGQSMFSFKINENWTNINYP